MGEEFFVGAAAEVFDGDEGVGAFHLRFDGFDEDEAAFDFEV